MGILWQDVRIIQLNATKRKKIVQSVLKDVKKERN